jgi:serine/threonine-protein kinase
VKPENILLSPDENATLCDLGFAQPVGRGAARQSETTSGTPAYMSPDQARGVVNLRPETDLYALGLSLYAMLSGGSPFRGSTPDAILAERFQNGSALPDLQQLDAPPQVKALLERMLRPEHLRRQRDLDILLRDLETIRA